MTDCQPIHATITDSDHCEAEGYSVRGYAPVLDMCRELIEAGHNPSRALHAYRCHVLALKVRSIGEGAKLAVEDDATGKPRLRRWRDRRQTSGAASPICELALAA